MFAVLLYHGIRRDGSATYGSKTCKVVRAAVLHFSIKGKRGKVRFVPVQVLTQRLTEECLSLAGHAADTSGPVFPPGTNNRTKGLDQPPGSIGTSKLQSMTPCTFSNAKRSWSLVGLLLRSCSSSLLNTLAVQRFTVLVEIKRPDMPSLGKNNTERSLG